MTKFITLNGREYKMAINFGTLIVYERLSGNNALDFAQFAGGKVEPLLMLGYAMLTANNDAAPNMDELLQIENIQHMSEFLQNVSEIYIAYIKPEPGDQTVENEKEDDPKND